MLKVCNLHKPVFFFTLFCFLVWVLPSCKQQSNVDRQPTMLDSLIERANSMKEVDNFKGASKYIDSVFALIQAPTVKDRFAYYHFYYDMYYDMHDTTRVLQYTDSMIWLLESTNSQKVLSEEYAIANYTKADRLFEQNNFIEAFRYYHISKEIAKANRDSCILGYFNYKLGMVLYRGEQYSKSIRYFKESFDGLNSCGDWLPYFYRMQELDGNIALCYNKLGKYDSALIHFNAALVRIEEGKQKYPESKRMLFEKAAGVVFGNMGTAYMGLKKYHEAETVFLKSIRSNEKKGYDNYDAQYTRIKLADLYIITGRLQEAGRYLDVVKMVLDTLPGAEVRLRWYNSKWKYANAVNNPADAGTFQLAYFMLKDSLNMANRKIYQMDLDGRVQNMEHETQITALEKTTESRNMYLVLALFACLMSVIIGFLVYLNWRESRKHIAKLTELNDEISAQKQKLEAAISTIGKSTDEKDRILKAVSHDMRSPVNSALALTDLLLSDKEDLTAEQQSYLELIRESCNNALFLTKDLLEAATLKTEELKKEALDVNSMMKGVTELLGFKAAEKNQQINLTLSPESIAAQLNKEKMTRVINNLVNNAIKFSPSGGQINVAVSKRDNDLVIAIKDNGIGIPDNIKDKIFDLFTEAKRFGTSGEQPYGLGLSISRQIVEAHGGHIWFDSVHGAGTTFYVSLPLL